MFNFVAVICDSVPQDNAAAFFLHLSQHAQNGQCHKRVCKLPAG